MGSAILNPDNLTIYRFINILTGNRVLTKKCSVELRLTMKCLCPTHLQSVKIRRRLNGGEFLRKITEIDKVRDKKKEENSELNQSRIEHYPYTYLPINLSI